jgi:hypothetical protein
MRVSRKSLQSRVLDWRDLLTVCSRRIGYLYRREQGPRKAINGRSAGPFHRVGITLKA